MRSLALASLIIGAGVIGACSAIDDFTKFKFSDGGAVDTDMGGTLPEFGQACVDNCAVGPDAAHPLMCFHDFGTHTAPGGICTHTCSVGLASSCTSLGLGVADCVTVETMDVCLPHCDPSIGRNCRTFYSCCANHNVVTNAGDCAPSTTDLCH